MNDNGTINEFNTKFERELQPLFIKFPAVLSAYVFGSMVQGLAQSHSDIDIAVRIDKNLTAEQSFDIRLQLIDEIERCLASKIDVVILNKASLKLIHQVIGGGKIIFARNLEIEMDYVVQKQKEYFDFKYYIEKDVEELKAFFSH